jgi:heterotetrameric sarcosine oxidase gamma subunit
MADPAPQSATADLLRPHRVGPEGKAGLRLSERTGLAIWQIAAWRQADVRALRSVLRKSLRIALPEQPNGAAGAGGRVAMWIAPRRLWLVATAEDAASVAALPELVARRAAVTDLSHARTVLRLSGAEARTALAKLCRIDLHPKVFGPGRIAQTPLGQIPALIHCVDGSPIFRHPHPSLPYQGGGGTDRVEFPSPLAGEGQGGGVAFDLYLPRSLTKSATEMLIDAAAEFGLEIGAGAS